MAAGGGLIVLGETEQEKYGNNVNELLARFGIEIETATVQDYEHHHGDAPSWVLASLGDRLGDRAEPGADLLTRVDGLCFYRTGTLATRNGAAVLARAHPTASSPNAAARRDDDPRPRARRGARRLRPLRRRLHRRPLAHRPSGSTSSTGRRSRRSPTPGRRVASEAAADPAWPRLRAAVEELRAMQAADGSLDRDRPASADEEKARRLTIAIAESAQALKPRFPHQDGVHRRARGRPPRLGRRGLRPAGLRPLARGAAARARPARRHRAPRRDADVQAERLARHLLRGADRPRPVAGVDRRARARALRQPEVPPGHLRRPDLGLRLRVRRPLPGDGRDPRAPVRVPLRGDLLRPRGGAPAPRLRAPPPRRCGSTCRPTPPACSPRRSSRARRTCSGT